MNKLIIGVIGFIGGTATGIAIGYFIKKFGEGRIVEEVEEDISSEAYLNNGAKIREESLQKEILAKPFNKPSLDELKAVINSEYSVPEEIDSQEVEIITNEQLTGDTNLSSYDVRNWVYFEEDDMIMEGEIPIELEEVRNTLGEYYFDKIFLELTEDNPEFIIACHKQKTIINLLWAENWGV